MEIFIRRRDSEKGETMKEGNMTFGNIFEAIKRTDDNNKFRNGRQKADFFFQVSLSRRQDWAVPRVQFTRGGRN